MIYQTNQAITIDGFLSQKIKIQKKKQLNVKLQLINIKYNIIKSDEDVKKEFENNEPIFEIIWTSFQQPAILKNVKEAGVTNCRKLFEQNILVASEGNNMKI
ncbi:hypothetical protein RFI_36013 [Reticulomyxa filosa]|uniref:Uncharacterized protein n=1 Tax=Reticulomyxa filosa TaxID=46433 RepID=X6LJX4_RETFI|nr:hypothetical protein RFI_36013 [Reticulomyxa filosa]|eukprot:ETO01427.1 hypothetical protein RFI_36013 [Reticulomyxa filosa]